MPGSTLPTSQLDRATRDLLKSFGWGIAALNRLDAGTKLPSPCRLPIASLGVPLTRVSLLSVPLTRVSLLLAEEKGPEVDLDLRKVPSIFVGTSGSNSLA